MTSKRNTPNKQPYAAIWGGYGGGNVGDYLTLAIAADDMKTKKNLAVKVLNISGSETDTQFPEYEVITVLNPEDSGFKRKLKYKFEHTLLIGFYKLAPILSKPFIRFILSKMSFIPWLSALANAELLYFVGGGYINDLFNTKESILALKIANMCGIPVETAPLGIGPFRDEHIKAEFAEGFSKAILRVRDEESLALIQSMGLCAEIRADDGFRVEKVFPQWFVENPSATRNKRKPKVGVCIFEQFGEKREQKLWWNHLFTEMHARFPDIELEGFSFDSRPKFEYNTLTKLLPETGWKNTPVRETFSDFREAMAHLKHNYDAVITCRFHAAVVSQVFNIPTIAYASGQYYIAKMESVQANSKHCVVVSPATHTPSQVLDILEQSLRPLVVPA